MAPAIAIHKNNGCIACAIGIKTNKKHWLYNVCQPNKQHNIGVIAVAIAIREKYWCYSGCHRNIQKKTQNCVIAFAITIHKNKWCYNDCHRNTQKNIGCISFAIAIIIINYDVISFAIAINKKTTLVL